MDELRHDVLSCIILAWHACLSEHYLSSNAILCSNESFQDDALPRHPSTSRSTIPCVGRWLVGLRFIPSSFGVVTVACWSFSLLSTTSMSRSNPVGWSSSSLTWQPCLLRGENSHLHHELANKQYPHQGLWWCLYILFSVINTLFNTQFNHRHVKVDHPIKEFIVLLSRIGGKDLWFRMGIV